MPTKTVEAFADDLWDLFKGAAKDLLEEDHVRIAAQDLIGYAARAQFLIYTTDDPETKELAEKEFMHRTASLESYTAGVAMDVLSKHRLTGILEGIFSILLKYGPAIISNL